MKYTHYVKPGYDVLGLAGEVMEFDDERAICLLRLHAVKGIHFVAVLDKKALNQMEVVR